MILDKRMKIFLTVSGILIAIMVGLVVYMIIHAAEMML